jgi:hypothetical protein
MGRGAHAEPKQWMCGEIRKLLEIVCGEIRKLLEIVFAQFI